LPSDLGCVAQLDKTMAIAVTIKKAKTRRRQDRSGDLMIFLSSIHCSLRVPCTQDSVPEEEGCLRSIEQTPQCASGCAGMLEVLRPRHLASPSVGQMLAQDDIAPGEGPGFARRTAEGGCPHMSILIPHKHFKGGFEVTQISRITGMISGRFWLCLEM
jgi:hypothetical protein